MEQPYEPSESNGKKTLWIIGGIILVVMIIALVYGATQKTLKNAETDTGGNEPGVQLNTQNQPKGTVSTGTDTAVLGAAEMIELPVTVKGLDVVNLQTFPQRVQSNISYNLQGNCAVLDTPTVTVSGKVFTVVMTSHAPKDAVCTKDSIPGDTVVEIPVAGLAAGKYTVKAGKIARSLTMVADNQIQYSGDK